MTRNLFPLLGLVAPAGSGKDVAAGFLTVQHGYLRVGFADKLKAFVRAIDPAMAIAEKVLGSAELAKLNVPGFRDRLIEVGSAAREIIYEDIWIDAVDLHVEQARALRPVVVTDVRYRNEARWLSECGGLLVAVDRAGTIAESDEMVYMMDHADFTLVNNGDETFGDEIASFVELIAGLDDNR